MVDLEVVRGANLNLGVDPMGGAGVHYWPRIAEQYGLKLTVIDQTVVARNAAEKATLARLSSEQVKMTQLAGETSKARLTRAPGNDPPIGGLKVVTNNAWFVARPAGTEDMYRIYAESFLSHAHLRQILAEAEVIVDATLKMVAATTTGSAWPVTLEPVDSAAVAVWRNEGDPN